MTSETTQAAKEAAGLLGDSEGLLQPERVRDELFKLLHQTDPGRALRLLEALNLLDTLLPFPKPNSETLAYRLRYVDRLSKLVTIISPRRDDNTASDVILGLAVMVLDRWRSQLQEHLYQPLSGDRPYLPLAVLTALTPPSANAGGTLWGKHLRLSNDESQAISRLIEAQAMFPSASHVVARTIHRYYRVLGEAGVTGVILALARFLAEFPSTGMVDPAQWGSLLDEAAAPLLDAFFRHHQQIVSPPPLLTGNDLMEELALSPGPAMGWLIAELLEAQAAGEIRTRGEALALARHLLDTK